MKVFKKGQNAGAGKHEDEEDPNSKNTQTDVELLIIYACELLMRELEDADADEGTKRKLK